MKKISGLIILLSFLAVSSIRAQLFFCDNYTDGGEPIGVANTFRLGENGGYVYMLYSNKKKTIHQKSFNLVVTKQSGKDYMPYRSDIMNVQDKKTWAVADFHFTETGTYKVSLQDNNGHAVAGNFVSVFLKNAPKATDDNVEGDPATDYYNMKVSFCTGVEDGAPVGLGSAFTTGKLTIFLSNEKVFGTDSMIAIFYKKGPGSQTYDLYDDLAKYGIQRTGKKTYFTKTFTDGGEYSVEIYNRKYAKMGSGYVTIQTSGDIDKNHDPDMSYYNAKTTFCESVADGVPVKDGEMFKPGQVYVYVLNDNALHTDSIIVDVMKKAYESENYNIYVTTKNYGVNSELKGTYFPMDFDETGKYRVSIYNRKMQRISEGYVTIR